LLTLGGRKIDGKLSVAIRKAVQVQVLWAKEQPPPSKKSKNDRATEIESVVASVQHNGLWYYIVKWKKHKEITLMQAKRQSK